MSREVLNLEASIEDFENGVRDLQKQNSRNIIAEVYFANMISKMSIDGEINRTCLVEAIKSSYEIYSVSYANEGNLNEIHKFLFSHEKVEHESIEVVHSAQDDYYNSYYFRLKRDREESKDSLGYFLSVMRTTSLNKELVVLHREEIDANGKRGVTYFNTKSIDSLYKDSIREACGCLLDDFLIY